MTKFFSIGLMANLVLLANVAQSAEFNQPHINVTGVSQIEVKPDTANISISVSVVKPKAIEAKEDADHAVANLMKRLIKFDLKKGDITSANLNLSTEYRYPPKQERQLVGYRASRDIKLSVSNLDKVSKILDESIKSGVNQVNSINFSVKDKNKYLEEARALAIKDAKAKARSLAKGFDSKLAGVWEIRYQNMQPSERPVFKDRMMFSSAAAIDNSYQNSKITFSDRVQVVFLLK